MESFHLHPVTWRIVAHSADTRICPRTATKEYLIFRPTRHAARSELGRPGGRTVVAFRRLRADHPGASAAHFGQVQRLDPIGADDGRVRHQGRSRVVDASSVTGLLGVVIECLLEPCEGLVDVARHNIDPSGSRSLVEDSDEGVVHLADRVVQPAAEHPTNDVDIEIERQRPSFDEALRNR